MSDLRSTIRTGLTRRRFVLDALIVLGPLVLLTVLALRTLLRDQQEVQSTARREAALLVPQLARNTVLVFEEAMHTAYLSRQAWNAMALAQLGVDARRTEMALLIKEAPSEPFNQAELIGWGVDQAKSLIPGSFMAGIGGLSEPEPLPQVLPPVLLWRSSDPVSTLPRPKMEFVPVAPWVGSLGQDQRNRWWRLGEGERAAAGDPERLAALADAYRSFGVSESVPALRILAEFHALRLRPASFAELERFVIRNGPVLTESGVPLAVAGAGALIQAWQAHQPMLPPRVLLDALVPILILHPHPMNLALIRTAEAAMQDRLGVSAPSLGPWLALEEEMERTRRMFGRADVDWLKVQGEHRASWYGGDSAGVPSLACTVNLAPRAGGAIDGNAVPEHATVLFDQDQVQGLIRRAIGMARLPDWAGVRIALGEAQINTGAEGIDLASTVPVQEDGVSGGAIFGAAIGTMPVNAVITLARPELLMASVSRRQRMYGLLVLAVAGTAGFGLFQARRSFQRQLQLAEMRSGFVSSVSHELRAPIASIRLLAEGLERGNATSEEQRREYLRFIVQECRRLSGLIENVLDYARIEQGRKAYDPEPVDVIRLVQDTVRLMEPCAESSKVSLSVVLPPDPGGLPEVVWDAGAIQQALVNLIDNAVKHSPEGAVVTVSLRCRPCSGAGEVAGVEISVADAGPGIPKAEHARIFEQFYRRGSELRRETRGIGIGLSLVKHTVENHGGRVIVASEPGMGSTFTLAIPAKPVKT